MNLYAIAAASLLASALAFGAGWTANGWRLGARIAGLQADQERANADEQRAGLQRAFRVQEVADTATARALARPALRRAADVAGNGLRLRTEATGRAVRDAAAAGDCKAAADAFDLQADVSRRLEEAGRELADVADQRGDAGLACQQSYDALSATRADQAAPLSKEETP